MAQSMKPIKVWGRGGPNPPKVAFVLEELGLPYEIVDIPMTDVKEPYYLAVNPNGRLPSIQDPNTNLTLWESGAIILYLIDKYDTDGKLSFPRGSNDSYLAEQWLAFQISGQGPYFGQAVWFESYHPEKLPSAIERYLKEIHRVTAVLEKHLEKQKEATGNNEPWLVGDKCSYADLSFIMWQILPVRWFGERGWSLGDYPLVNNWIHRMVARKGVSAIIESNEMLKGILAMNK